MKVGKLYKVKPFHTSFDDVDPENTRELEREKSRQRHYGWHPKQPWNMWLNAKEGWSPVPEFGGLQMTPGQLVLVFQVESISKPSMASEGVREVFEVGLLIDEKRYSACFSNVEWFHRFEEVKALAE